MSVLFIRRKKTKEKCEMCSMKLEGKKEISTININRTCHFHKSAI